MEKEGTLVLAVIILLILFFSYNEEFTGQFTVAGSNKNIVSFSDVDVVVKDVVFNQKFNGYGINVHPWFFNVGNVQKSGNNIQDWKSIVAKRVMLNDYDNFRIFVNQSEWEPSPGVYTWNSIEMNTLHMLLDIAVKQGIKVNIVLWQPAPWAMPYNLDWPNPCTSQQATSQQLNNTADSFVELFMHLFSLGKDYDKVVRKITFINEPFPVGFCGTYSDYLNVLQRVKDKLEYSGLSRIRVTAPDTGAWSDASLTTYDQAMLYMLQNGDSATDVYNFHLYTQYSLSNFPKNFYINTWYYAAQFFQLNALMTSLSKDGIIEPFILSEIGAYETGTTAINQVIDSHEYGLLMAQLAVAVANGNIDEGIYWMMDDSYIGSSLWQQTHWGLWKNKTSGFQLRPWYYSLGLQTRFVEPSSEVLVNYVNPTIVDVAAFRDRNSGDYTIFLVNTGKLIMDLDLELPEDIVLWKYIYDRNSYSSLGDSPIPAKKKISTINKKFNDKIPAESFVVYSSRKPSGIVAKVL